MAKKNGKHADLKARIEATVFRDHPPMGSGEFALSDGRRIRHWVDRSRPLRWEVEATRFWFWGTDRRVYNVDFRTDDPDRVLVSWAEEYGMGSQRIHPVAYVRISQPQEVA